MYMYCMVHSDFHHGINKICMYVRYALSEFNPQSLKPAGFMNLPVNLLPQKWLWQDEAYKQNKHLTFSLFPLYCFRKQICSFMILSSFVRLHTYMYMN